MGNDSSISTPNFPPLSTLKIPPLWLRQLTRAGSLQEVRHERWDDLVIGATKGAATSALGTFAMGIGTSHPKAPTAEWELTSAEWEALWKDRAPTLRVILEIAK